MTFFAAPLNLLNRADAFMSASTSSLAPRCNVERRARDFRSLTNHNGHSETAVLASTDARVGSAQATSSRVLRGRVASIARWEVRPAAHARGRARTRGRRRRGPGGRARRASRASGVVIRNRQPSVPATPDAAVEDAVERKDAAERKLGKDGARGASAAASTLASIARELRSALAVPDLALRPIRRRARARRGALRRRRRDGDRRASRPAHAHTRARGA